MRGGIPDIITLYWRWRLRHSQGTTVAVEPRNNDFPRYSDFLPLTDFLSNIINITRNSDFLPADGRSHYFEFLLYIQYMLKKIERNLDNICSSLNKASFGTFDSQLVIYSSRIGSLKDQSKSCFNVFKAKSMLNKQFLSSSKTHCDSSNKLSFIERKPSASPKIWKT